MVAGDSSSFRLFEVMAAGLVPGERVDGIVVKQRIGQGVDVASPHDARPFRRSRDERVQCDLGQGAALVDEVDAFHHLFHRLAGQAHQDVGRDPLRAKPGPLQVVDGLLKVLVGDLRAGATLLERIGGLQA